MDILSAGPSRSSGDFLIYKETITEGPKYRIKLALVSGRPLDSRKTTTKVKRGDRGDRTKEIDDGLIKKSLSLGSFHLVSYYTENDLCVISSLFSLLASDFEHKLI